MGRKIYEVQETVNKDFNFCQAIFCVRVKVATMACANSVMP